MHMVEPKPNSAALGSIQEEANLHLDGARAPANSVANTPGPSCSLPNELDFNSSHRRRDSIPNVDKLIRLEHKM